MTRNQRKQRRDEITATVALVFTAVVVVVFCAAFVRALALAAW